MSDDFSKYHAYFWRQLPGITHPQVYAEFFSAGTVYQLAKSRGILPSKKYNFFVSQSPRESEIMLQSGGINDHSDMDALIFAHDYRFLEQYDRATKNQRDKQRFVDALARTRALVGGNARHRLHRDGLDSRVLERASVHEVPEHDQAHFLAGLHAIMDRYELHEIDEMPTSLD